MQHVVYHCLKAAEVIHCFPVFSYLWPFSWKLKARLAAEGLQHRPRMFFLLPVWDQGKIVALVPLCPCVRLVSFFTIHTFFPSCASRFETPRGK